MMDIFEYIDNLPYGAVIVLFMCFVIWVVGLYVVVITIIENVKEIIDKKKEK